MTSEKKTVVITLSIPTVFPDLNKKEGHEPDFETTEITIQPLKFKHFRKISSLPQEKQMLYAISTLTGLSDDDVDVLYAEDAAEVTKVILGYMKSFMDVAKTMFNDEQPPQS